MSKKFKTVGIISVVLSILIVITTLLCNNIVVAAERKHVFYTKGINKETLSSSTRRAITDWTDIKKVYVDQRGGLDGFAVSKYSNTLNLYNVYCIEHGAEISGTAGACGWYNVGPETELRDRGLAYLLYHGATGGTNPDSLEGTWRNANQKQVWAYLYDNKEEPEISGIIGDLTIDDDPASYTSADTYRTNYNRFVKNTPTVTITEKNSTQLTVTASNCFDSTYTVKWRGDGGSWNTSTKSTSTFTLNKGSYSKIEVMIEDTAPNYVVKYRVLTKSGSQRILVVTVTEEKTISKQSSIATWAGNTNISLQKYITKVESATGDVKYDNATERKNKYAKTGMNSEYNHSGYEISNISGEKLNNNDDDYKYTNPVKIDLGDKVTYTIKVYNNSSVPTKVTVKDKTSKDVTLVGTSYTEYSSDTDSYNAYNICENLQLSGGEAKEFKVTFKYDAYREGIIENSAWISATSPNNKKEYRTLDADYVEMYGYSVGLEKFVTEVNGIQLGYDEKYDVDLNNMVNSEDARKILKVSVGTYPRSVLINSNRGDITGDGSINSSDALEVLKWVRLYSRESYIADFSNVNFYTYGRGYTESDFKVENKVPIEVGDTVTYTIRLTNTNLNTSVRITQIFDTFISTDKIKLVYDDEYGINGNGGGNIKESNYKGPTTHPEYPWSLSGVERYLIEFPNAVTLEPGKSEYLTIRFKVEVDQSYTNASQELYNTAGIMEITDKNGNIVNIDSDGYENNVDMDWVETKTYSVALEKFVTQVTYGTNASQRASNATSIEGRDGHPIYDDENYKQPNKTPGPVKVEPGDYVTFTIRVKNTKDTSVRVTQIEDEVTLISGKCELQYVGQSSISGTIGDGDPATVDRPGNTYSISGPSGTNGNKYTLTSTTSELIDPGEYEDIQVIFEVKLALSRTSSSQTLNNYAKIVSTSLSNRNNCGVLDTDGTDNNSDRDWIQTKIYKVSLEKYVSKVTYGTTAENRDKNATEVKDRNNHPIYAKNGFDKENHPVEVEVGDYVTYTIKLKNDGDTSIKIKEIEDDVTQLDNGLKLIYVGRKTVTGSKGNMYTVGDLNENKYKLTASSAELLEPLEPNDVEELELTFKVDVNKDLTVDSQDLKNVAKIIDTSLSNRNNIVVKDNTSGDNSDEDWVKTKIYSVSLEKYITKVTDAKGDNPENILGRKDHPIYDDANYKQPEKTPGPVEVEVGDLVTYTIKLTNTNTNPATKTQVKIRQIEDNSDQTTTGLGLTYVRAGEGSIGFTKNGNTITLDNPPLLEPGQSIYLKLVFEVEVARELTVESRTLVNTAQIVNDSLVNRNNYGVIDSEKADGKGIANNEDSDWVKTKIYSVSLEKYITKVTDAKGENSENISGRENHPIYDDGNYKQPKTTPGPVEVEPGDLVTYTIKLTNTNTNPATKTQVKIKQIEDISDQTTSGLGLTYEGAGEGSIGFTKDGNTITLDNPPLLEPGQSIYLKLVFKVEVDLELTGESRTLVNTATIVNDSLVNRNDSGVNDSEHADGRGIANNTDSDWVQTKTYAVSLEKYVSKVTGKRNVIEYNREELAEHEYDNDEKTNSKAKYNKPVVVSKGNTVTYTIKLMNDGNTKVTIDNVKDYLPDGVKYNGKEYNGKDSERKLIYCTEFGNGQTDNKVEFTDAITIEPKTTYAFTVDVEVIEPNMSLNILKNVAEIGSMQNRNELPVNDTTGNNNKDADYIQLDYYEPEPPTTKDFIVEKQWADNDNKKGARTTSVSIQLYRNGEAQGTVKLNEANNWKHKWEKLPKFDEDGNEYVYVVREVTVPDGYVATYSGTENKTTVTNTYGGNPPETTQKDVSKEWLFDKVEERPGSVKVQLYKVGQESPIKEVTLNSGNEWRYTWKELDNIDDERNENVYYVQEEPVPEGYKVNYEYTESGFVVQNIYETEPEDSDDSVIAGNVWNDKLLVAKDGYVYDGIYDAEQEAKIEGIDVYLYRVGVDGAIAKVTTNADGYYSFGNNNIKEYGKITKPHEQYIKGAREENTQRWAGTFYSYYIVFEYDGVKYTSTLDGQSFEDIIDSTKNYTMDSNASEGNNAGKVWLKDRTEFNKEFETIKNSSGINYTTENKSGSIPQSTHNEKDKEGKLLEKYKMQSSTSIISFEDIFAKLLDDPYANEKEIESGQDKLQYVGLGLRGRDIFDLELTSDVDNIKVTVNGVQGVYKYTNKLTLRKSDIVLYEDMANIVPEKSHTYVDSHDQNIREQDLDKDKANTNGTDYSDSQEITNIQVTYRITVHNASHTKGTATKVTNYYDDNYTFDRAYAAGGTQLDAAPGSVVGLNSVVITTPGTMLGESEDMEIYVVYNFKIDSLEALKEVDRLATYNMSEITEYTTECGKGQTEYTRGLLDKDSAPGSASIEKARLEPNTEHDSQTTVGYYFGNPNNLHVLKYEDDTYATPTLYFVRVDSPRKLTGTVFEDLTVVDKDTRIKTGDGKLDPNNEKGIFGATVELIEINDSGSEKAVRYRTSTDENGLFEFKGYLPGNYIIKYHYGDTEKTALIGQVDGNDPMNPINSKSYNGEDFQATNNGSNDGETGIITVTDNEGSSLTTSELSRIPNYWYSINELEKNRISTATDNGKRRKEVSEAVCGFDDEMKVLNYMRDLIGTYETDTDGTKFLKATHKYDLDRNGPYKIAEIIYDQEKIKGLDINAINLAYEVNVSGISDVIEATKMFATTEPMLLTIEETVVKSKDEATSLESEYLMTIREEIDEDTVVAEWAIFPSESDGRYTEYLVEYMNFGIAEVPVTTLDLEKTVSAFSIKDSTGENILASFEKKADGKWEKKGIVDINMSGYGVQIEDEKLQGARLEITFDITGKITTEVNFDNQTIGLPAIKSIADFVSNNLSYNPKLGSFGDDGSLKNEHYWDVAKYVEGTPADGSNEINKTWLDLDGKEYTTVLKAKDGNPLLTLGATAADTEKTAKITLEKVLTARDSTIDQIITSTIESFEYSNTVEILELDYSNVKTVIDGEEFAMKDRIRTSDRYIIIPGVHHDSATSQIVSIIPPTGDTSIYIVYYIIAAISLAVLAIGAFGIKKFVVKKQ